MKRMVLAAAIATLFGPSAWADGKGKVVMTVSAGPETNFQDYLLFFRTADGEHQDSVRYGQHNWLLRTSRDFDDAQGNGVVKILDLAPGDWQIDNFEFTSYAATIRPYHPFEVHFTVKPGTTTYIGDYRVHVGAVPSSRDPQLGNQQLVTVYFSVTDQSARDVAIARKKDGDIGDVEVALPEIPPHTPNFLPRTNKPAPSPTDPPAPAATH